ncbi:SIMPL domain-containing protein [Flavobacterium chuncheonense]|uniref:SIMPL domain-containing protein n=1 Tax=Flavobacterium chuncheonense TaxID=2026653 RepID=A0ABW5YJV6_9FLAO
MKKFFLVLTLITAMVQAQTIQTVPQISVVGEGKIKVTPDEAFITVGVENIGKDASEVKRKNDEVVESVIKTIKKQGIAPADFKTEHVSLNKNFDYQTKKYSYKATQTISIHLKDLSKYDVLMMELVDSGINNIQGVDFKSSKLEELQSEIRKKAILNAKKKAEDYAGVLGQKVGKAIAITDNSQTFYPQPVYRNVMMAKAMDESSVRETLAIGEIEISSTVNVSFELN